MQLSRTNGFTAATLPYVLAMAGQGWLEAARSDPALAAGLNTHDGVLLHPGVAAAHGMPGKDPSTVLG